MRVSVQRSTHEKVPVVNPDRQKKEEEEEEENREQASFQGLDLVGFILVVLLILGNALSFYVPDPGAILHVVITILSNIAYPVFLIIPSYLFFKTIDDENPDYSVIVSWCVKILIVYVVLSLVYLPVDIMNWLQDSSQTVGSFILHYIQRFVFESAIPQLWILPALALPTLLIGYLYKRGISPSNIMTVGIVLYVFGMIGDNDFYLNQFPELVQTIVGIYFQIFLTLRNAVFYGFLFVSLGLSFAKTIKPVPIWESAGGTVLFLILAGFEVNYYHETDFVISTAFAAAFIFMMAQTLPIPETRNFSNLGALGKWMFMIFPYLILAEIWLSSFDAQTYSLFVQVIFVEVSSLAVGIILMSLSDTRGGRFLKRLT